VALVTLSPPSAPVRELDLDRLGASWLLRFPSENTRKAYGADFRSWAEWCSRSRVHPLAASRTLVTAWARVLELQELRPSTVSRKLAAVHSFYAHAVREGVMEHNPAADVPRPRTGEGFVELTPGLTRAELVRLLHAAEEPRDRALVLLLALTGLRVSEALGLDLDAVEDVRGHRTFLVRGKGGREGRVPIPAPVVEALEELARAEERTTGPVFRTRTGARLGRREAHRLLRTLGTRAELPRAVSPHMLRVSAITGALEAGAPLHRVQELARHSDPKTTQRYNRARGQLDGHAAYALAGWLSEGLDGEAVAG